MAKSGKKENAKKKTKLIASKRASRAALKKIIMDKKSSVQERMVAVKKLSEMPRGSCMTQHHNRCRINGRPRGYLRKFGMCRVEFRKRASEGEIPGVVKSSW